MKIICKVYIWGLFFGLCFITTVTGQDKDFYKALKTIKAMDYEIQLFPYDYSTGLPWGDDRRIGVPDLDGLLNTQRIIQKLKDWNKKSYAALMCAQIDTLGFSDWYLPSIVELQIIYNAGVDCDKGLLHQPYWSSTEDEWGVQVNALDFNGGIKLLMYKNEHNKVRCIRRKKDEDYIRFKHKENEQN